MYTIVGQEVTRYLEIAGRQKDSSATINAAREGGSLGPELIPSQGKPDLIPLPPSSKSGAAAQAGKMDTHKEVQDPWLITTKFSSGHVK